MEQPKKKSWKEDIDVENPILENFKKEVQYQHRKVETEADE